MDVIRLSRINKIYGAGDVAFHALKNVSFAIGQGDFVAIKGPSGSGKTTLLDILGCISNPDNGDYFLEGKRVDNLDDRTLAQVRNRKIGFVFQNFHLIPGYNLLENVELPLTYTSMKKPDRLHRAREVLAQVGLEDKKKNLPNQLSGGQRQRVAIARALINKPHLLLADEPTGNLDSKTGLEILQLFQELNRAGSTIVMITHDAEIGQHASRSIQLKDGEVITP